MDDDGLSTSGWSYVGAYALWAVSVAASVLVGLLVQSALVQMATIAALDTAGDPGAALDASLRIRFGDVWSYMLMGLILVAVVVFVEYWYRTGVEMGRLLARFLRVTVFQVALLFVVHSLYFAVARATGISSWSAIYVPLAELAGLLLCAFAYGRVRQPDKG
jgi:hypothetical protein